MSATFQIYCFTENAAGLNSKVVLVLDLVLVLRSAGRQFKYVERDSLKPNCLTVLVGSLDFIVHVLLPLACILLNQTTYSKMAKKALGTPRLVYVPRSLKSIKSEKKIFFNNLMFLLIPTKLEGELVHFRFD